MKKRTAAIFWPIVAMVTVFLLGFVVAASRRPDPVQVEVVTRSGPSAAASISLVLFGTLGVMVLMAVGAVAAVVVIRARQHTQRMEQAALLFGARQPQQPTPQRRPRVGAGDGPSVVIVSGQSGGRVEDMRNGYNG